jgi:hypothetical protein
MGCPGTIGPGPFWATRFRFIHGESRIYRVVRFYSLIGDYFNGISLTIARCGQGSIHYPSLEVDCNSPLELPRRNRSRVYVPAKEDGKTYARARRGTRGFRRAISRRRPNANGYLAKTPGPALRRANSLLPRQSIEHYFGVCEQPGLRQRMLHRQLGEAEEFPAWKDKTSERPN